MDSLKKLLDSRQYELVIKLTNNATEANDLFYRIAALTCLGQYEDALYVIQDHQQVLESNMNALITIHIQILCVLERYDQAYSVLDYYSNLPYQSQVVEETLRKMPEVIAQEEKKSQSKFFSEDEVIDKLSSKEKEEVLFGLDLVKKRDVLSFLPYLKNILISHPNQTIRSLTLMLLVEKEVDRDLKFLSRHGLIDVNPKKTKPPFTGEVFNRIVKEMDTNYKDTTISQNGGQILSTLAIYIYPDPIDKDDKEIALAIYVIARRMLSYEDDVEKLAEEKGLSKDKIESYIILIEEALNDF